MALVIKKGVKDPYVVYIQRALNEFGANPQLKPDGDFGGGSEAALKAFQTSKKFEVTGIYQDQTAKFLDGFISDRYLTEEHYVKAAGKLGAEVACVKAVQTVESRGAGFLPDGRVIILFERHVFRKQLAERMKDLPVARAIADKIGFHSSLPDGSVAQVVSNHLDAQFSDIHNKDAGGYIGMSQEWGRLEKAMAIDEVAALCSASYGLFQIMGFHWKLLGYTCVQAMVEDQKKSESAQLLAFCSFILANPALVKAIRGKDWKLFAKNYNGPNYASHKPPYDQRLGDAYKQLSKGASLSSYTPVV